MTKIIDRVRALISFRAPPWVRRSPGRAAVQGVVDDGDGWQALTHAPGDRPWGDVYADLESALEAWRRNFLVRRVVNVTRSYTVGSGIALSSDDPEVDAFIAAFWHHPKNRIARRLGPICDQLTRDGELFPVLFTNAITGMSYLRFKTARQIREVVTDPEDYETELRYVESTPCEPREWLSPAHPRAFPRRRRNSSAAACGGSQSAAPPHQQHPSAIACGGFQSTAPRPPEVASSAPPLVPLMLHWAVNKPLDATRGESDLTPILPWALRYSEWLKDRVRLNRQRTRAGLLDIAVADDTQVATKRRQLRRTNPIDAGIYVHGPGETVQLHHLAIDAQEAEADGEVLRLAVATGANLALHYLGEGESTNYATAKEMGEPTARFYADRQQEIIWFLKDLVTVAYRRYCYVRDVPMPADLALDVAVTEVARADNESLARAALSIIQALATARRMRWIDDETALSLALKFAGETLPIDKIRDILAHARTESPNERREE